MVPIIIFGGSAILAGGMTFMLPETKGRNLPQTLDELDQEM